MYPKVIIELYPCSQMKCILAARLPKSDIWRFPWNPARPGRSHPCRCQQQDVFLQGEHKHRPCYYKFNFQGDDYWRFEPRKKPHVASKYPQVISSIQHIQHNSYQWRNNLQELSVKSNAEHLKRVGRASQRLERWLPVEEQQELLLPGRHLLEI